MVSCESGEPTAHNNEIDTAMSASHLANYLSPSYIANSIPENGLEVVVAEDIEGQDPLDMEASPVHVYSTE